MMSERDRRLEYSSVVVPILNYINSLPHSKAINVHGGVFTERGTPDVIGCIDGQMVVFECKRDDTADAEPIQKWRLAEWITAGAVVGTVSDVWQVSMILQLMGVI